MLIIAVSFHCILWMPSGAMVSRGNSTYVLLSNAIISLCILFFVTLALLGLFGLDIYSAVLFASFIYSSLLSFYFLFISKCTITMIGKYYLNSFSPLILLIFILLFLQEIYVFVDQFNFLLKIILSIFIVSVSGFFALRSYFKGAHI